MKPSTCVEVHRGSFHHTISLVCTLCNYQFRSPKILPCYHSFCEACLYAVVTHNVSKTVEGTRYFSCPICRMHCPVEKGGVHTLQTNFVLAAQVIRLNMSSKIAACDVCITKRKPTEDPVPAYLRCWECGKFLCSKCVDVHRNLLKYHTLIQVSQAGPIKVLRNAYCGKHPEEQLRFYCQTCEDTICRDCRMTEHTEGHKTMDMADLQQSAKELVSKVNEVIVENFVPVLSVNTSFFKNEFNEKNAKKTYFVAAIRKREKILAKVVADAAEAALKHLDDVINNLEEESRMYEDNLSRMKSETEYNELVIECGSESDVMQAAINVMPYANSKSRQACLVEVMSRKLELIWEKSDQMTHPAAHGAGGDQSVSKEVRSQQPPTHLSPPPLAALQPSAPSPKTHFTFQHHEDPTVFGLKEFRAFADAFLGRVNLKKTKLTLSLTQHSEDSILHKCFRKIKLLVDAYKQTYRKIATTLASPQKK